jgi:hypothetical protein
VAQLSPSQRRLCRIETYDDIVGLFNDYIISPHFDKCERLKHRKQFVQSIEETYNVSQLLPRNANVRLHDGSIVTVPVFDAMSTIMDLLSNSSLINKSSIERDTIFSPVMFRRLMMLIPNMEKSTRATIGYLREIISVDHTAISTLICQSLLLFLELKLTLTCMGL